MRSPVNDRYLYEVFGGTYPASNSMETKTYIYSFLNWRKTPGHALISVAVTLTTVSAFFCFLWLLYMLRLYLVSKFTKLGTAVYDRHRRRKLTAEVAIENNDRGDNEHELEIRSLKSEEPKLTDIKLEGAELTGIISEE